jgi:hypothetical protein
MNWQNTIAISLLAAAVTYVVWRAWRALFGPAKAGCGSGCGSCPSTPSGAKSGELLKIETPKNDARRS